MQNKRIVLASRPTGMPRLENFRIEEYDGEPEIIAIGPIVGCHAGPGTIGLSFYLP